MRKFLSALFTVFLGVGVFATDANIPTTKSYVDTETSQKQDTIERATDANQALTNTGIAGKYGTKDIYDSTGSYAEQTDALVDAATMNAAVQNAINAEFVCISWVDDDPTKDCLLMEIRGTPLQSILPAEYTKLEYLESTGLECINSGVKSTPNTMVKAKFQIIGTPPRVADYGFLGSWILPTSKYYLYIFNHYADYLSVYTFVGHAINVNITDHDVHTLEIRANGDYYLDKTLKRTNIYAGVEANNLDIGIFRPCGSLNGWSYYMSSFASRFYHVELDDGETRRNMIPARRKSDSVLGMYDTVSNTFFENACTGEFIAGPVVYLPQGE